LVPRPLDSAEFDRNCREYGELATKLRRTLRQSARASAQERKLYRWLNDMKGYHTHNQMLSAEQRRKLEQLPYFSWAVTKTGKKGPQGVNKRPQVE
jgi:hypothetical protein